MNIFPINENCSKWLGNKISISEAVQAKRNNEAGDDDSPCEVSSSDITILPEDFLRIIFNRLETRDDRHSFGLTCRQWLHIQNNNWKSLWYRDRNETYPSISPDEKFSITDFVVLQPQFSASKLRNLCIDNCYYSDTELSLMFSWLPRLTYLSLANSGTTDRGLEALAKYCPSLKTSCRELRTLCIYSCCKITGIGFLGCPKTLTDVDAHGCELSPKGIEAIVSGGGLQRLGLSARYELPKVGQGLRRTS
ncbi:hypothetical protein MKW92_051283 [Papaver armeniacum]|nr:hypothetical protein MKW92_051283 [Papaver armeniacum]